MPAESPSFRDSVSEWPQARDGASAWAWRFLAALLLPQGPVLASSGSLARHAGSARVLFPAFSPESALRRGEESQKHAACSAQAVDYLLALALDLRPAGSLVILVGPESAMALERSHSAGSLLARLAILPEHFRSATVSVLVSPASLVFHLTASENRQASRKISSLAKHQALRKVSLQEGLVERTYFLQPLHLAKHPAHLAILPEHFCLAIVSVLASPASSVFRPALSENRQPSRKVSLQAGLVERTYFLQPLHWAKHPE